MERPGGLKAEHSGKTELCRSWQQTFYADVTVTVSICLQSQWVKPEVTDISGSFVSTMLDLNRVSGCFVRGL
jgi:hypothetical protein